jgi:hypothetical protein
MKQVEQETVVGREGKQLRAQPIQGNAHSQSDLHKMATVQRNVQCVLWLAKFEYRQVFNEEPPHENTIRG